MTSFLVPAGFGEAEYTEKRSRFIGRVWPVQNEEEALSHIEEMRRRHYDARHNVYAYALRENGIMRYSDDGEPSGTSGQPTLNVFRAGEIQNFCCVITRYFGGILLGTGGLVHAYSTCAKLALEQAGISRMALWLHGDITCSYARFESVKRLLERSEAVIENSDFGADVRFSVLLREDLAEDFAHTLTDATGGSVRCEYSGQQFQAVRLK